MKHLVYQYGSDALNTHDFIGWIESEESNEKVFAFMQSDSNDASNMLEASNQMMFAYREHNSQPMDITMFVPGKEPNETPDQYEADWHKWKRHQILFEGEFEVHDSGGIEYVLPKNCIKTMEPLFFVGETKILNDFLTDNKELKYNPKYELR